MNIDELWECSTCNELVDYDHFKKMNHLPTTGGWIEPKIHHCGYKAYTPLKWGLHVENCNNPTKLQKLFRWIS